MANIYYQEKVTEFGSSPFTDRRLRRPSTNQRSPLANISKFRLDAGTIEGFDVWTDFPIAEVGIIQRFTFRLNGVDLFPDPDDQADLAGTSHAEITGLAIDTDDGDILSIDLTAVSGSGVNSPLYFRVRLKSDALPAVGLTGIADGDILIYDAASGLFLPGTAGGGSSVGIFSPDPPYVAPDAVDDEFNGGSLDAKWTAAVLSPTLNWDIPGQIGLFPASASGMSGIKQAVANADGIWRMKFIPGRGPNGHNIGFVCKSSAGANYRSTFSYNPNSGGFDWSDWVFTTGSFLSHGTLHSFGTDVAAVYMEIAFTVSTKAIKFRVSPDGVNFKEIASATTLSSGDLESVGIFNNGTDGTSRVEWFRKLQGNYTGGLI